MKNGLVAIPGSSLKGTAMSKLTLAVITLVFAVTVVGLAATHAASDRPNQGPSTQSRVASHRADRSAKRHRLTQQQVLSLGCGPLSEAAAEAMVRAGGMGVCRR